MTEPLRVLSLSTLYPNVQHPNFGVFVERQMQAVAKRGDVDLTVINPIGLPPFPLSLHRHTASFATCRSTSSVAAFRSCGRALRCCPNLAPG